MSKSRLLVLGSVFALPLLLSAAERQGDVKSIWQDKIDPWVLEDRGREEVEFLVFLDEQADVSAAAVLPSKVAKGTFVYQALTATASRTQGPVIDQLRALGVPHQPYWVANMIWVKASPDVARLLALRPDVAHIYANPTVHIPEPMIDPAAVDRAPTGIEWNILKVQAPDIWAQGYEGQGTVVAGQDTGYQWDHPALKVQYRGWNGSAADHNYNWHDAIHSGGGSCGPNSPFPCDDYGHGTHTMGTMVGDDGGSNQIGMSPQARWIGCRNMDVGNGTPTTYSECFQWMIAPTDMNNNNPDPSKAPDVINNSWGCPPSEGCTNVNVLKTVVENTKAAGIVVVVSAGNSGPSCSTVNDPPAIYDASFSVGATDSNDNISSFSSRGPVTVDGSNRMKPDVSAPGENIRSSTPGNTYQGGWSGTSMAGPHVAGLVSLLICVNPALRGQVDQLKLDIQNTAVPRTTSQNCGGSGSNVPNNTYGWGRIKAVYSAPPPPGLDYVVGRGLASPNANQVKVFTGTGGTTAVDFLAYAAGAWGVNVASGQIDGATNASIVTGPGPGPQFGPQVKAFDRNGAAIAKVNFFAYGTLKSGANVGSGNLDGDAFDEILSGPGPGVVFGPHVRGWNYDGASVSALNVSFFAYVTLKYGVNVSAGSVDADAFEEIVTGPGPGVMFATQVRGFNFDNSAVTPIAGINFNAFTVNQYGCNVAAASFDADAFAEIAAAVGPGAGSSFPARFRGYNYDGASITALTGFDVTPFVTFYGSRVGAGDVNNDGRDDLICGAGPDAAADSTVKGYDYNGTVLTQLAGQFVGFSGASYGVNVAGASLGY
ncbi:MAG: S8 family serine peptidase [Acidobacteriota bacterium]